ncbi:MAG: hypothetical protein QJT81_19755 [Candidatus Thiothrix putei]|uniref:Uncharacterized protein n=1 Tax=Candidatus Thiothrix putei TaxID=3080811 RepID=A0AA95HB51_9GAMM|nr:MAG: hypothetical protein QJT81_19755 [Candidatus Thiothrix putei]
MSINNLFMVCVACLIFPHSTNANNFDIHGRDIVYIDGYWRFQSGWVGHLGVEYSNLVYHILPENSAGCDGTVTKLGQKSCLHLTSLPAFKEPIPNFKGYWGVRYDYPPSPMGVLLFLDLAKKVGVDYTPLPAASEAPSITYNARTKKYSYNRGRYRSDTFAMKALASGGKNYGLLDNVQPKYVFRHLPFAR